MTNHMCLHTDHDGTPSHECTCPNPDGNHPADVFSHFFTGYSG